MKKSFKHLLCFVLLVFVIAGCSTVRTTNLTKSDRLSIQKCIDSNEFATARNIVDTEVNSPAYKEKHQMVDVAEISYHKNKINKDVSALCQEHKYLDARNYIQNYKVKSTNKVEKEINEFKTQKVTEEINPAELAYHKKVINDTVSNLMQEKKFVEAREFIWTYESLEIPEHQKEINNFKVELLHTKINISHLDYILTEMDAYLGKMIKANDFKSAYAYLEKMEPVPVYPSKVSISLDNVNKTLKELKTAEPDTTKIFVAARDTLSSFFKDSTFASDSKFEEGYTPDTKEFTKKLGEFKQTMATYGCSEENQNALIAAIGKDAQPLFDALTVPGRIIEGVTTSLGTSKLNEMVKEAKEKRIKDTLIPKEIEYRKNTLLSAVNGFIKDKKFLEAREYLWKYSGSEIKEVEKEVGKYRIELLNSKVNVEDFKNTLNIANEKTNDFIKQNDFSQARAFLDSLKPIPIYSELITRALYSIRDELVQGIKADEKGSDKLVSNAEKLLEIVFANDTNIKFEPGEFYKPNIDKYNNLMAAFKDVLAKFGCDKKQQEDVIDAINNDAGKLIRALYRPQEGQDVEVPKSLGTSQYNKCLKDLKVRLNDEKINPAQIAFRVAELRAKVIPMIEKKQLAEAREVIHSYGITGIDSVDLPVAAVKIGLMNVLINPLYIDSILPDIKTQVENAVNNKEFDKALAILKKLKEVPYYSETIDQAIAKTAEYAVKSLDINRETYDKFTENLIMQVRNVAETRKSDNIGITEDGEKMQKLWNDFAELLKEVGERMLADDFQEKDVVNWLSNLKKMCNDYTIKGGRKCFSDKELNDKIASLRNELDVFIATKLAEEMARQEASKVEKKKKEDTEVQRKMQETLLAIAKDASEQIDFPARCYALKQKAIGMADEDLALVFLEAAKLLKLNERGYKINAKEATALVVSGAYLGFDDLINYGVALGAKVDTPCYKDKLARPPFLLALLANFPGHTEELLKNAKITAKDADGNNAIHYAIMSYNASNLISMLAKGIDTNAKGSNGMSPLILAADLQSHSFVKALIPYSKVDMQDNDGYTALMRAASRGRFDIVMTLLDGGANAGILSKDGKNVLDAACEANLVGLVQYLVKNVKVKASSKLINKLVFEGKTAFLDILVDNGVILDDSHLLIALNRLDFEMVKFITRIGVDVNTKPIKVVIKSFKKFSDNYDNECEQKKLLDELHEYSLSAEQNAVSFYKSVKDEKKDEKKKNEILEDIKKIQDKTKIESNKDEETIKLMKAIYLFMVDNGTRLDNSAAE